MRALFAVLAVAVVAAACSDGPTSPTASRPNPEMSGLLYCPGPFTMISVGKDAPMDHNADGFICELIIREEEKETLIASYVDNNVPMDLGACPEGFEVILVKTGEGADRNEDGWECRATRPNGNVVLIDNRFDVGKKPGEIDPHLPK